VRADDEHPVGLAVGAGLDDHALAGLQVGQRPVVVAAHLGVAVGGHGDLGAVVLAHHEVPVADRGHRAGHHLLAVAQAQRSAPRVPAGPGLVLGRLGDLGRDRREQLVQIPGAGAGRARLAGPIHRDDQGRQQHGHQQPAEHGCQHQHAPTAPAGSRRRQLVGRSVHSSSLRHRSLVPRWRVNLTGS
jgi:hypothetical protein